MLSVQNLSFSYQDKPAVSNAAFKIDAGAQVALIGESGCGKSTLLKLLYGIFDPDAGRIEFNGNAVLGPKLQLIPGAPFMQYLAQDFGLMPYSTSAENVGASLSNTDKPKKKARIMELLDMVEMADFAAVKPNRLSGGQQQRIALAKALASRPGLLLLDEPFSQIDLFRANTLRRNLFQYFRRESTTVLMATHDSSDVLSFCDGLIAMKSGEIVAEGNSAEVYRNPPSRYVASLFGDVNEVPASLLTPGKTGTRLIFPHRLKPVPASPLMATVRNHYFLGNGYRMECVYPGGLLFFDHFKAYPAGALLYLAEAEK
jgi:ABC-type sulfate/molybdate transport systems ATPase subunit